MAKISERAHLPWRFTVVDVPGERVRGAGGAILHHPRGSRLSRQRGGARGRSRTRDRHVTARHSAQHTRRCRRSGRLIALGIFVPAARPFGDLGAQALACCSSNMGATTSRSPISWVRNTSRSSDGSGSGAGVPVDARTTRRSRRRSTRCPELAVHSTQIRLAGSEIQPTVQQLKAAGGSFSTNRDAFGQRIDGIVYGDNPSRASRGSRFLHPVLRFRIDFPEKWEISNSLQQVVAKALGANVFMLLQLVEMPRGRNIQEIAQNSMDSAGSGSFAVRARGSTA